MASVKLILFKGKKYKDDRFPVMAQIIHDGKVRRITLGGSAHDHEWDEETKLFKINRPNYKWLNNLIHTRFNDIEAKVLELQRNTKDLSMKEIVKAFDDKSRKMSFFHFIEDLIKNFISAKQIGNAAIYTTVLHVVKSFTNNKDFSFKEIDYKWLSQFETYHLSKGNSINGLNVYFRTIRAIFNKAIKEGYARKEYYPFDNYKIKSKKPKKRAIKKDDVEKIRNLELIPGTEIWNARNYFLFSFYTQGMNWIDMAHLKLNNLVDGRIEYRRSKNGKAFSIKINTQIHDIIDLYSLGKKKEDFIFPILKRAENPILTHKDIKNSLKTFNKYLDRIGKQCGIETKLTSYVSRHSWGTIGSKELNIPLGIISKGYGHEDLKTTQIYLEDFDDAALDKANELITN